MLCVATRPSAHDVIRALARLGDQHVASGGYDGRVHVWDLAEPARPAASWHRASRVLAAADVDGHMLAIGHASGHVDLIDRRSERVAGTLRASSRAVLALAALGSMNLASAGADEDIVRFWDLRKMANRVARGAGGAVRCMAVDGARKVLYTSGSTRTVAWSDGCALEDLRGPGLPMHGLAVADEGASLVAGGLDDAVWSWSLRAQPAFAATGRVRQGEQVARGTGPFNMVLAKAGGGWWAATSEGVISGPRVEKVVIDGGVRSLADVDGVRLVTGGACGDLRIWTRRVEVEDVQEVSV